MPLGLGEKDAARVTIGEMANTGRGSGMARTPITVQYLDRFHLFTATSPAPILANTVDGNLSINDGFTYLEMTLTGGVARTVTVTIPGGVDVDLAAPTRVYTLGSNGVYATGVFPVGVYGAELMYTASGAGVSIRPISFRGGV